MSAELGPSVAAHHGHDFDVKQPLLILSVFAVAIGCISSVGAIVLLGAIRLCTNLFFFQTWSFALHSPAEVTHGLKLVVAPVLGGLMVGLLARFGSEAIRGHGIPEAIEAILYGKSRLSAKVALLKPLSSGIAIGSGGPFGAEGPIIMTGGAVASLLAQAFHLTAAERKALLVAGACAGMTAVFGTPLAAMLLAVELLLFELRPRSLLPVAVSCAVAGVLRALWAGGGPLFPLTTQVATPGIMLTCCLVGLASGLLATAMSAAVYRIEDLFHRLPIHWMWWPALGGLAVGLGGLIEPRALGAGYDVIGDLLQHHLVLSAVLGLLLVKLAIWAIALGSGTSGGVLAPLLIIGAGLGSVLSGWLPGGTPMLWALVCMAATLGGMMRAPLTAVAFAFGLTHDANGLLPTILSCAIAYGFTVVAMPRSILTEKIARRGRHVFREYGVDPLERSFVAEVMTPAPVTVSAQLPLTQALGCYFGADQRHRAYPVVEGERFIGMLDRALLACAADRPSPPAAAEAPSVGQLLGQLAAAQPPAVALPTETGRAVALRLAALGLERMAVVENLVSLRLLGIVSRSDLLKPARALHEEEVRREGWWGSTPAGLETSGAKQ